MYVLHICRLVARVLYRSLLSHSAVTMDVLMDEAHLLQQRGLGTKSDLFRRAEVQVVGFSLSDVVGHALLSLSRAGGPCNLPEE